jgi:hypothetical protein
MGKKKPEEMAKEREKFTTGAVANQVDEAIATYVFDLMEKFAGYGFNKSHSAAYALVAYQTAWLKANYPAEYMAANLTNEIGLTEGNSRLVGASSGPINARPIFGPNPLLALLALDPGGALGHEQAGSALVLQGRARLGRRIPSLVLAVHERVELGADLLVLQVGVPLLNRRHERLNLPDPQRLAGRLRGFPRGAIRLELHPRLHPVRGEDVHLGPRRHRSLSQEPRPLEFGGGLM